MKKNTTTISIGIPVHNEAENILNLLSSIVRQKASNFSLEHIYVICDGTTDGTDKKVKIFSKNYPFITVLNDKKRKGKMKRLMELYKRNTSDLLFIFDGDVVLGKQTVIETMIKKFDIEDTVIVSANNQPVPADTFTGKLITYWSHIWYLARRQYNSGDNVHNIRGCGMALEKDFAKTIIFPPQLASESQYIYFFAITKQKTFKFAHEAIVLYRKPTNVYDYSLQTKRSTPEEAKLAPLFGGWIHEKYIIPRKYKILAILQAMITNPFIAISATVFHIYTLIMPARNTQAKQEVLWKRPTSTKQPIQVPF